jgi:hypothetical protein
MRWTAGGGRLHVAKDDAIAPSLHLMSYIFICANAGQGACHPQAITALRPYVRRGGRPADAGTGRVSDPNDAAGPPGRSVGSRWGLVGSVIAGIFAELLMAFRMRFPEVELMLQEVTTA